MRQVRVSSVNHEIQICVLQQCKTVTAFEIMPQPPPTRGRTNPWPEWPVILRIDYGHEEHRHLHDGKDPRVYAVSTKVLIFRVKLFDIL